jgi:hypothetical protein
MCSVIVHFLHCICVYDCDGCHKSLIVLSQSVMVRRSHLLARCYLGTMCMCTTSTIRICKKYPQIYHNAHITFLAPSLSTLSLLLLLLIVCLDLTAQ